MSKKDGFDGTRNQKKEVSNKRALPMNLYVLRWNPAVSSFKNKDFEYVFSMLNNGECPGMDWSICEPEKAKPGDWWVLDRVGGNSDGIVGIGRFVNEPEPGKSWRNDGRTIYYVDLEILMLQKPEKTGLFSDKELQKICPEINWNKGHSGVLIQPEAAEKLARHLAEGIVSRRANTASQDFSVNQTNGIEFTLVSGLLSQLCPELLADLKKQQEPVTATEMYRIPDYQDEIAYDEDSLDAGKGLFESLRLLSWENVIPIEDLDDPE